MKLESRVACNDQAPGTCITPVCNRPTCILRLAFVHPVLGASQTIHVFASSTLWLPGREENRGPRGSTLPPPYTRTLFTVRAAFEIMGDLFVNLNILIVLSMVTVVAAEMGSFWRLFQNFQNYSLYTLKGYVRNC